MMRGTLLGQHDEAMHRAEPDSFSARARAREGAREEERKLERDREVRGTLLRQHDEAT
jgi:hypothetical protein